MSASNQYVGILERSEGKLRCRERSREQNSSELSGKPAPDWKGSQIGLRLSSTVIDDAFSDGV